MTSCLGAFCQEIVPEASRGSRQAGEPEEKIVLMATHDPILALMGDRRVIINNGAMQKVIEPSEQEKANLTELRALDEKLMGLRDRLRRGERLDEI